MGKKNILWKLVLHEIWWSYTGKFRDISMSIPTEDDFPIHASLLAHWIIGGYTMLHYAKYLLGGSEVQGWFLKFASAESTSLHSKLLYRSAWFQGFPLRTGKIDSTDWFKGKSSEETTSFPSACETFLRPFPEANSGKPQQMPRKIKALVRELIPRSGGIHTYIHTYIHT